MGGFVKAAIKKTAAAVVLTATMTAGVLASGVAPASARVLEWTGVSDGKIVGVFDDGTYIMCDSSGCG